MKELSIRVASEPSPSDDDFGSPRRMSQTERLQFIAIFIAAILLSMLAALVILPFALFAFVRKFILRRTS